MHVAIVTTAGFGVLGNGQGMANADLARSLAAAGDRVTVYVPLDGGPESRPTSFPPGGVVEVGVEVVTLRDITQGGDHAVAAGAEVLALDAAHDAILSRHRATPSVVLLHGRGLWRRLSHRGFANGVICAAANYADEDGLPAVCVVHPVDPAVSPAPDVASPAGDAIVLAGVTKTKGAETFLACAKALPHLPFVAIRTRPSKAMEALLAAEPNVEVLPQAIPEDELLATIRVLLVPSKRESYGMAARLAASAGRPVIASDLAGLRESCGEAAVYLDPDDHKAWAKAAQAAWDRGGSGSVPDTARDNEIAALRSFLAEIVAG